MLPDDPPSARIVNAATMELGATVCTARAPRCDECPIAGACAWRRAGYPPYQGPRRAVQAKFAGSDRQVRGLVMRELRGAHHPVTRVELEPVWADAAQLGRAIDGLLDDGLVVGDASGYRLPDQ